MTDQAKKKEEAKKEIRSLLLSAPLGLTIVELKRDFSEFIGKPLPWKELGYSSAEDFVQDIPDTVKITWTNTGMVLTGVANNSTKHIEKMVQCQKVDSKVKKKVMDRRFRQAAPLSARGGGDGGWGQRSYQRPHFNFAGNTGYQRNYGHNQNLPPRMQQNQQSYQRQRARHQAPPPSVPAYVRGQISQLVSQHNQGLPLTHFCSIFRSRFGVPLDFRELGFSTEQDLLASLRDIIGMRTLAGGEMRVMSLQACVAWDHAKLRGETESSSSSSSSGYHTGNSNNRRPLLSHPSDNVTNYKPSMPLTSDNVSHPKPLQPLSNSLVQPERLMKAKGRGRGGLRKDFVPLVGSANTGDQNEAQREQFSVTEPSKYLDAEENCNIPMTVQNEIRQIMTKRPKGVCASRLPFEYKDMFRRTLSTKTFGYNSVIEFVSDLPHIIRVERPFPQGDWFLYPAQNSNESADKSKSSLEKLTMPSASSSSTTETTTKTPSPPPLEVDKALKESVAQVMCISSDGIPLDKFQETYQAVTGKTLNVSKYGPGGLKRILHSMSDIVIISLDASDKAIVLPKMNNAPRRFDQLQDQFQPIVGGGNGSDSVLHLPNDAVSPGCKYRHQPLPAPNVDGEGYIELYVSNILNPDMFWIQLRGRKTTLALEDLMDELEAVYSSKSLPKEYNMTPLLAQKGMLCAVIFPEDSFWHRGFILGLKDQLYQVYYVDYGNTCYVSIDQMRLLKTKFLKLPAQAIQARLGHIKPIGGEWKNDSTQRMLAMAREKPLVGLVVAQKDRVLSLCLTDTSKEEDIHFNDMFVDEGYAVFEPESGAVKAQVHEEAPSSFMLYGEEAEDEREQARGDAGPETIQRYVRQAQMIEDVTMNLINLHGQLYLSSAEISALFFQQDVISSKLQRKNVDIEKIVVDKRTYPDLFNELLLYESLEMDNTTETINLFPLAQLPLIIELFGKDNERDYEELKSMALELLQWFDPEDPFWKGEDDAASTASQNPNMADAEENDDTQTHSSADDSQPSLEDLQQVLKTLEIKRKRILARMLKESPTAECVNELNSVELYISRVEALISKLESESATSSSSSRLPFDNDSQDLMSSLNSRLVNTPSQAKTTNKVAPMVQPTQEPSKANPLIPSLQQQTAVESNPPPLMPAMDLNTLLQQQIMMNQMNQMMMQQLGLSTPNPTFPGQLPGSALSSPNPGQAQLLRNFGQGGLSTVETVDQFQLLQSQLLGGTAGGGMTMPLLSESPLQNSQLFSQQQHAAFNPALSTLGMNPRLTSGLPRASCAAATSTSTQSNLAAATPSIPPGLGVVGVPGLARGRTLNSQPVVGAVSPQPQPSGLQAMLQQQQQQQQPNFALSALQRQNQRRP